MINRIVFPPYRSGQVGERLNSTLDASVVYYTYMEFLYFISISTWYKYSLKTYQDPKLKNIAITSAWFVINFLFFMFYCHFIGNESGTFRNYIGIIFACLFFFYFFYFFYTFWQMREGFSFIRVRDEALWRIMCSIFFAWISTIVLES